MEYNKTEIKSAGKGMITIVDSGTSMLVLSPDIMPALGYN